ncbi:UPF0182 family protein [Hoyosella rhizosphaerae]|uniref:UPF0182 family protein n=1 Tax=Hoyosella rhizosphaerae TaxID=1755582 RepID=UPI0016687AA0|nr:UPF0182 family protein [Hoyosella rhizosphaerae]MBN4925940.1 UPF0182 family protein [Hoyosella rhizosphaerae]
MGIRPPTGVPSLSRRSRILIVLAAIGGVLLAVGPRLIDTYVDWLWFGEVGYRNVFTTVLLSRLVLFLVVGAVVGLIIFGALLMAYRTRPDFAPTNPQDPVARYRSSVNSRLRLFAIGIPVALGAMAGLVAQGNWTTVQLFLNRQEFGVADPEFGLDVGFYAFSLPFYELVLNWLFVAVVMAFVLNLVTHYIYGGLRLDNTDRALSNAARIQLAVLAGTFVLLKAVAYWFDRYALLSSGRKEPTFTGAGFTDINAVLPAKLILLAIAVICALAFFAAIVLRDMRIPALAAGLLLLSSVLVGAVWPLLMEQFSVRPNAVERESPYIERNIAATRDAYGINPERIDYIDYSGVGTQELTESPADITTIQNIRLLDPNILSRTFTQQQQLKNFFGFPDQLNVDRYEIDGELRDYIVSVRELNPPQLAANQRDWINQHTVYTHGNGFVAAPANRVNAAVRDAESSDSGYPIYAVSDITSQERDNQIIPVEQPRIYYGELIAQMDPDYAIVGHSEGATAREYDTDTQRYTYTGEGGVAIGNWPNRLAFFAKYSQRNILFSDVIGPDSKILFKRDPRDRVEAVAPWLVPDSRTYPAVVDGRIVWVVDAYTTLDNYPYAQRSTLDALVQDSLTEDALRPLPPKEVSYIRNAVKATVDAYDGSVKLYEWDEEDPVLKAWMGVFPDTVLPNEEISDELRAHFRYPEDLFKVQREMLSKYHVDEPIEFFTNNAFWSVPSDPTVETGRPDQPPYYVLIGDPETGAPSFQLTSPMVGFNRELLASHISVSSDPATYGQFTIRQLPTDTQTQGPQQAQNSMTSDTRVASDRTLLERSNRLHYGNLLTLPVGNGGILYVEPLYTERNVTGNTAFPQLARVMVSYRGEDGRIRIGYDSTLAGALGQVFGAETAGIATAPGGDVTRSETAAEAGDEIEGGLPVDPDAIGEDDAESPLPPPPPPVSDAPEDVVAELDAALANLRTAQQSGNFSDFGSALERLDRAVAAYQEAQAN